MKAYGVRYYQPSSTLEKNMKKEKQVVNNIMEASLVAAFQAKHPEVKTGEDVKRLVQPKPKMRSK